ncbi:hypothetical protein BHE74_00012564 [Ensete ventricosum]|nr:hypothetical protein BHE74_00012564 [Ensete ventricosum]
MLGQIQIWASGQGSDDVVGTHWKIAEGIRGLPGVRQKLVEDIGGLLGVHWELTKGIRGLPRFRQELTESDQELAGNLPRVLQKMTETHREFTGGYREDHRDEKCKGLVFTHERISFSGLWWASTKEDSEKRT